MRVMQLMMAVSVMAAAAGAALLGGCEPATESRSVTTAASTEPTPIDKIAPEGAINCSIVCVSEIAKDSKAHAGRTAARGVVSKVFADRRAFTVSNIVEGATCCATGCGEHSIPARVPADQYVGDLPEVAERVIVVGEVIPSDDGGFEFAIEEVWADGKVVIRKQV